MFCLRWLKPCKPTASCPTSSTKFRITCWALPIPTIFPLKSARCWPRHRSRSHLQFLGPETQTLSIPFVWQVRNFSKNKHRAFDLQLTSPILIVLFRSWCPESQGSEIPRVASLAGRKHSWVRRLQRRGPIRVYWLWTAGRHRTPSLCLSIVQAIWQAQVRRAKIDQSKRKQPWQILYQKVCWEVQTWRSYCGQYVPSGVRWLRSDSLQATRSLDLYPKRFLYITWSLLH